MSMISSLIDELNKSADEWSGSNMFELARMCREAADTITELRGALHVASVDYRHLEAENAKLRELVRGMWEFVENVDASDSIGCPDFCEHDTADDGCCKTGECWYERRMRELGIEVDG